MSPWFGTLQLQPDGTLSGGIVDALGWQIQLTGTAATDAHGVTRWKMSGEVVIPDRDKLPWELEAP